MVVVSIIARGGEEDIKVNWVLSVNKETVFRTMENFPLSLSKKAFGMSKREMR